MLYEQDKKDYYGFNDDFFVISKAEIAENCEVVVTMLPIMLVYPFLQKYFMSGLTVGAVKG